MKSFNEFNQIQKQVMVSGTKYKIIYADCPWEYKDNGCSGGTKAHYQGMPLDEIMKLPVDSISDDNSVLFIWGTWALLPECLKVIESWGFKYKSKAFVWIKTNNNGYHFGLGKWSRSNSEFCLLATKGKPQRKSTKVSELITAPITKHSRKPDVARRKIIQLMGELPRIELFARTKIHGWDTFGDDEKLKLEPLEVFL